MAVATKRRSTATSRLGVNINKETEAALNELAEQQGVTVTELVRRAIGVYYFLDQEVRVKKGRLKLVDAEGSETGLAFL